MTFSKSNVEKKKAHLFPPHSQTILGYLALYPYTLLKKLQYFNL